MKHLSPDFLGARMFSIVRIYRTLQVSNDVAEDVADGRA